MVWHRPGDQDSGGFGGAGRFKEVQGSSKVPHVPGQVRRVS